AADAYAGTATKAAISLLAVPLAVILGLRRLAHMQAARAEVGDSARQRQGEGGTDYQRDPARFRPHGLPPGNRWRGDGACRARAADLSRYLQPRPAEPDGPAAARPRRSTCPFPRCECAFHARAGECTIGWRRCHRMITWPLRYPTAGVATGSKMGAELRGRRRGAPRSGDQPRRA